MLLNNDPGIADVADCEQVSMPPDPVTRVRAVAPKPSPSG